jgi:hypothetical protein
MRSSIALILGTAAIACVASAAPSQAGGTQICRPTGTSPILYTCDSGGFENSVAYSTSFHGPSLPAKGGDHSCNYGYSGPTAAASRGAAGAAGSDAGAAAAAAGSDAGAAAAAGPSG